MLDKNTGVKPENASAIVQEAQKAMERLESIKTSLETVVLGQNDVIIKTLTTLLSGGHALIVGVPGLAKTLLVETLGTVLGLETQRIQFTPDLIPTDILGSEVLEQADDGKRAFRFIKGPVFAQLLMADEINRASPRTQSALLQAMQEHHVTIAGKHYDLPQPFHVLATQNPIEQDGTYPLPEAQLDRFLMQIDITYPEKDIERSIVEATTGTQSATVQATLEPRDLLELQKLVRKMPVGSDLSESILDLVRALRPNTSHKYAQDILWGPGPRATQALSLCCRARALVTGRFAPALEDLEALAVPVLKHRMALSYSAIADGLSVASLVRRTIKDHLETR